MALPEEHKPVVTPLPAPAPTDFMDEGQWEVLWALLDGASASIAPASSNPDKTTQISVSDAELEEALAVLANPKFKQSPLKDVVRTFLAHRPSQDPAFREDLTRTLSISPQRHQLAKAIGSLK